MKKIITLVSCLLITAATWADDTLELYVGEKGSCDANDYMNHSGNIEIWNIEWQVDSYLDYVRHTGFINVTPTEYYSGYKTVKCSWLEYNRTYDYTTPKSHTWKISCKDNPIQISPTEKTLAPGETFKISASLTTSNFTWWEGNSFSYQLSYSSKDRNVATVDNYGNVTAVSPGTTQIVVSSPRAKDEKYCKVTVEDINVVSVTLSSPIGIEADQSQDLQLTVEPSNGTIKTMEWETADPSIASIERTTGRLTGVWPGTTTVWCTVNGTIRSNDAEVKVTEPSFTFSGFSIQNEATGVETLPTITATFSHTLNQGDNYSNITLMDANGNKVTGTVSISGATLIYKPSKRLEPLTQHTLTIPARAVKNKWGTGNSTAQTVSFTTTDWQRMTLTVQPEGKFIAPGEQIVLTCSESAADIFYSTNGSEPTKRYTAPIVFANDMTLRALARLDGYYDSELQHEYIKTVEIAEKFPSEEPLYVYGDVNPSITYSDGIAKGSQFSRITMKKDGQETIAYRPFIQGKTLFLVPNEPLEPGCVYTINMPEGALVTEKGEESQALDWHFNTGYFATAVSTGGPELMAALMTDHSLWTWGRRLTEANAEDGSYSYTTVSVPASFITEDVVAVSSGYTHHAIIKRDGSLWMWGRQLCGEFGNSSTTASAQPVKVMDGVKSVSCGLQTTAVVKKDGTLWMCGRNDLGQIDESRTVHTSFIKIANGVSQATLHWGAIGIEKTDGTTEKRIWDENADSQRQPSPASIDNATEVAYGWKNAIALLRDGSVWTWGTGSPQRKIINGRNPQPLAGIRILSQELLMEKNATAVIAQRPMPLLADYDQITWHSDNEDAALVNERGVVTTKGDGVAIVTATIVDNRGQEYSATCKVVVGEAQGISNAKTDVWKLHAFARNRQLVVSGVPEGQEVRVFSASGAMLWHGPMQSSQLVVPVNQGGIYLVKAARQVRKVAVR